MNDSWHAGGGSPAGDEMELSSFHKKVMVNLM